ncbi:acireductone synthase [Umezawaea sp. Da 62-37]|uniref:acireductone synthase n=1 Tax=Umezawaea sp. Da 62-37 TaxID=3075927 RepID=UPI0028F738C9|nr:acireductone synthase [Umezawaea sp. Da 62-37]WNV82706.1 acireductone synthase [Umezawaea sp. Da 62-37]
MSSPTWVVLDIEGTLSSTHQVLVVLYDYARPRLGPWIDAHPDDPAVVEAVAGIRELADLPASAGTPELVAALHDWMDRDQKVGPLKALQGLIWQQGYSGGDLVAELFPDVVPALKSWHEAGMRLAVFSSGSVAGQVAFFGHTTEGDLTPLFEHHFDTVNAGPKREEASYKAIAAVLDAPADGIVFYSDVPAELHAAASAGWGTVGVARIGEPYGDADFGPHRTVRSL